MATNEKKKCLSKEQRQEYENEIRCIDEEINTINEYIYSTYESEDKPEEEIKELEMYYNSPHGKIDLLVVEKEALEEKLFEDDFWKKNTEYTESYRKELVDYFVGNVISDNDCDIEKDVFRRKEQARSIADTLCKQETKGPFNIGILGNWGQGKTTFVEYIKNDIKKNNNSIIILDYNASEYDEKEQIWANLATCLFKAYEKDIWFSKSKFYLSKMKVNYREPVKKIGLTITIIIVLLILEFMRKGLFSFQNIVGDFAGNLISISAAVLAVSKIWIPLFKSVVSASIPLSNKIIGRTKLPNYVETLGTRAEIASDLNILFDAWLKKDNKKVVIFVDELDRCTEKGIVEFFQSIQLLIKNQKLCFVFAVDIECLENAFVNYGGISKEEIKIYLSRYLDKYVSVIIPLNEVIDYNEYIEEIATIVKPAEQKFCFTRDEIDTIKLCVATISSELLTPRKVKKIINILILLKEYCVKNINKEYAIKFEELITWYIFAFIYQKESRYILSLYNEKRKYTPLKRLMNPSNIKLIEEDIDCKKYLLHMREYSIGDINLYHYISQFFAPEVS